MRIFLAGTTGAIGEAFCRRLRAEGTRNLVDAATAAGVRRVISQSIAFAYPHGGSGPKTEDDSLWLRPALPAWHEGFRGGLA